MRRRFSALGIAFAVLCMPGRTAMAGPFPRTCADLGDSCRTVVVFGDTQDLTDHRRPHADWLKSMVDWVIENRAAEHIDFVLHVGDITENGWLLPTSPFCRSDCTRDGCACPNQVAREWKLFTSEFKRLEDEKIPFAIVPGNHDNIRSQGGAWDGPGFSDHYSPARLARLPGYLESKTSVASGCTATAWQFSLGGGPVIVLGIPDSGEDLRPADPGASRKCAENDPEIESWARELIQRPAHASKLVILLHHQLFNPANPVWVPRNKWLRIVREGTPERFLAAVHGHFQGSDPRSPKYWFMTERHSKTHADIQIFVPRVDWQDQGLAGGDGTPTAASSLAIVRFFIREGRPAAVEVGAWSEFFRSSAGAAGSDDDGLPLRPYTR